MKAIVSCYYGATTNKGSRMGASDSDGNRIMISCRPELNSYDNHVEAVKALCKKMKWEGKLIPGNLGFKMVWVWETEDTLTLPMVEVWYWKDRFSRDLLMGYDWCEENNKLPDPKHLDKTHVHVKDVSKDHRENIFVNMQGENWSPNGEANTLIHAKGLSHTSMSVGDVLVCPDGTFFADTIGFKRLD